MRIRSFISENILNIFKIFFIFLYKRIIFISIIVFIIISGCKRQTDEEQLEKYNKMILENPLDGTLYRERAILYNQLSKFDESMMDINKAIELGDKDVKAYSLRGILFFHRRNYSEAIPDLTTSITFGNKSAYALRAFSYAHERKYELAINDFLEANKTDSVKKWFVSIADCYFVLGQYKTSINEWEEQSKIKDVGLSQDFIKSQISVLQLITGDYNNALNNINLAIQSNNHSSRYFYIKGIINYKLKNRNEAIQDFNHAIALNAKSYLSEYYLSSVYADDRQYQNALTHFDRAIQKGFDFYDLINENNSFNKIRKESAFQILLKKYSSTKNANASQIILAQIIARDSINPKGREHAIVEERMDAIMSETKRINEYRKLKQLLMECD